MGPEQRREVLASAGLSRFTPRTITSLDALNAHLEKAARDGYACAVEEFEEGLNAIATPVRDHTGQVIAALSASGPAYRFTRERLDEVVPDVVAAAAAISHRMGHLD
jgi:DNA-binding IclR family transcriptional regulator